MPVLRLGGGAIEYRDGSCLRWLSVEFEDDEVMNSRALTNKIAVSLIFALWASPAGAVTTEFWQEHQPEEFEKGKCDGTVISSLGRVLLGRAETEVIKPNDDVDFVNALAQGPDGPLYAATGPSGIVYRIAGGKTETLCKIEGESNLFSLLVAADGSLLVGTGGEVGRIYRVTKDGQVSLWFDPTRTVPVKQATSKEAAKGAESAPSPERVKAAPATAPVAGSGGAKGTTTTSAPATTTTATTTSATTTAAAVGVHYIWAMARGAAGQVYAATGPEGMLLEIDRTGKACRVLFDSKETNLLSLVIGREGQLYSGSDKKGLIYRIDPKVPRAYVLYDTGESDVSALALDAAGNLYAGTAAPSGARPGRTAKPKPSGTPGTTTTSAPTQRTRSGPPRTTRTMARPTPSAAGTPVAPPEAKTAGNAVYRITPDGMVTEVFREPVMILSLAEADGVLYLGTGNEGRVYEVRPDREEQIPLAKLKDSQVTSVLRASDGRLYLGTSNRGRVLWLSQGYAPNGTFVSQVLDAKQIARWGRMLWEGDLPKGTRLTVATRSGNVSDPEEGTWETWSAEFDARQNTQIPSPSARFLQYRLTLTSSDAKQTPLVRRVKLARQLNNLPPKVTSLEISNPMRVQQAAAAGGMPGMPSGEGEGEVQRPLPPGTTPSTRIIKWKASDPDGDQLIYDLYFRQAGTQRWILLKEDIKPSEFKWETNKVGDGPYEIRVVAKDSPSNPPQTALTSDRISDPVVIDNTPPEVGPVSCRKLGKGKVRIHAVLADKQTPITAAHYALDSHDDWVAVLAEDDLFDSTRETISFELEELKAGEHVVTIRARDEQQNLGFASIVVNVEE
jgi:hypothetical protein